MKKAVKTVLLLAAVALLALTLCSCVVSPDTDPNTTERTVVSISVDYDTIPEKITAGENPDISLIKVIVVYSDGETENISASMDMVSISDVSKFNKPGTQTVSLIFGGKTTKFSIYIERPETVYYTVVIREKMPSDSGNGTVVDTQSIESGLRKTFTAADKSSTGYAFSGWFDGGKSLGKSLSVDLTVSSNMEIVAMYTEMKYKVYFDVNGGIEIGQMEVREISYDNMPVPERAGYVFTGWMETGLNSVISFTYKGANISLPASIKYTPETVTASSDYYYQVTKGTTLVAQWEELGLIFTSTQSGYMVDGYTFTGERTYMAVPEFHAGEPVVGITKNAFGRPLGDGGYSYESASKLKTIKLSRYISAVEDYAFSNCVSLTNIILDQNNQSFEIRNSVIFGSNNSLIAYPPGKMAASYTVIDTVSSISAGAFMNANLGSIIVQGGRLTTIGSDAFNSRTIDNVVFLENLPVAISDSVENMFSTNISHIYVESDEYVQRYSAHAAFAPFADKLEKNSGSTPVIRIYDNILMYRRIDGTESAIEVIGADRSIKSVSIPAAQISGYTFTSVAKYAFSYCYQLNTVSISNESKIDRILTGAFDNTPWLSSSTNVVDGMVIINNKLYLALENRAEYIVPGTVIRVMESAFEGLTELKKVVFAKNTNGLTVVSAIMNKAFNNCKNLSEMILPKTVTEIGVAAFANTDLSNFTVEAESLLAKIGADGFYNAVGLRKMDLYQSIESVREGAFRGCTSLENIILNTTDNKNSYYKTVDGVLFAYNLGLIETKDNVGEILHTYPAAKMLKEYAIPEGTKTVSEYAFYYANIGGISFPSSITTISTEAIFVPQLAYVQFATVIPSTVPRWEDLFARIDGQRFTPSYIFIADSDNAANYVQFGNNKPATLNIVKRVPQGTFRLISTDSLIYRYDNDGAGTARLAVIGALRNEALITFPEQIVDEGDSLSVTDIAPYAFMSRYMKTVQISEAVRNIAEYAFYYSPYIERVILKGSTPPTLSFSGAGGASSVLSFHPDVLLENALVFVPAAVVDSYKDEWPTDDSYILAEGTYPTVTLENGEASIVYSESTAAALGVVYSLEEIATVPVVTNVGHTFAGWYDGEELVSFPYSIRKNVTLTAKWTVNSYKITYQLSGGSFDKTPIASVAYGSTTVLVVPTRAGYDFAGWVGTNSFRYTDANGKLTDEMSTWTITADLMLIASWQPTKYTVTLDANKGTLTGEDTVTVQYKASDYTITPPTRTGYNFLYWQTDDGTIMTDNLGVSFNSWEFTENMTFSAEWEAIVYTVGLVKTETGSEHYTVVSIAYDAEFTLEIPTSTDGRPFLGWFDGVGGTGNRYTDEFGTGIKAWDKTEAGIKLYAQWPMAIRSYNELDTAMHSTVESRGFMLMNDIVAGVDDYWTPIENFTGILDGNGFSIINFKIKDTVTINYGGEDLAFAGLVAINNGIIRNLTIGSNTLAANMTVSNVLDIYAGMIAGINGENGVISNCNVTAKLSVTKDGGHDVSYIGGICGYNEGRITDATVKAEMHYAVPQEHHVYAGVIAGYHAAGDASMISGCRYELFVADMSDSLDFCGNIAESTVGASLDTSGNVTQGALGGA